MSVDELALLRSLRADVGVLDETTDQRIRARIVAGLAARSSGLSAPVADGQIDAALDATVGGRDQDAGAADVAPFAIDHRTDDLVGEDEPGDDLLGEDERHGPDEFGLFAFDPTPSEVDQRSDTPATLRPRRGLRGRPRPASPRGSAPTTAGAGPRAGSAAARAPGLGDDWDIADAHPVRDADEPVHPPARSGPSRALRVIALAAALVLLVAGGVAITRSRPGSGPGDDRSSSVAAAAAPLSIPDLVALLRGQPAQPLGPGQFQYTHQQVGERRDTAGAGSQGSLFVTQDRQRWLAADGSGREVLGSESARPYADPASPPQDIGNAFDVPLQLPNGFAGLSYDELQALPTDPAALRARLLAAPTGFTKDLAGLARITGELLQLPATPPTVRAALLTMLEPDGLRSVGDRTDRLGRRGSGFVLDEGPRRWTYVVDRATGRVLGWEQRTQATDLLESDALTLTSPIPSITDDTGGA